MEQTPYPYSVAQHYDGTSGINLFFVPGVAKMLTTAVTLLY